MSKVLPANPRTAGEIYSALVITTKNLPKIFNFFTLSTPGSRFSFLDFRISCWSCSEVKKNVLVVLAQP